MSKSFIAAIDGGEGYSTTAYNAAKKYYKKAKSGAKKYGMPDPFGTYSKDQARAAHESQSGLDGEYGLGNIQKENDIARVIEKMEAFYAIHDPGKDSGAIRRLAQWHDGNEDMVNKELRRDYGVDLTSIVEGHTHKRADDMCVEAVLRRKGSRAENSDDDSDGDDSDDDDDDDDDVAETKAPTAKQRFTVRIGGGKTTAKKGKSASKLQGEGSPAGMDSMSFGGGGHHEDPFSAQGGGGEPLFNAGGGGGFPAGGRDDPFNTSGDVFGDGDPFDTGGHGSGGHDPFQQAKRSNHHHHHKTSSAVTKSDSSGDDDDDPGWGQKPAAKPKARFHVKIKSTGGGGSAKAKAKPLAPPGAASEGLRSKRGTSPSSGAPSNREVGEPFNNMGGGGSGGQALSADDGFDFFGGSAPTQGTQEAVEFNSLPGANSTVGVGRGGKGSVLKDQLDSLYAATGEMSLGSVGQGSFGGGGDMQGGNYTRGMGGGNPMPYPMQSNSMQNNSMQPMQPMQPQGGVGMMQPGMMGGDGMRSGIGGVGMSRPAMSGMNAMQGPGTGGPQQGGIMRPNAAAATMMNVQPPQGMNGGGGTLASGGSKKEPEMSEHEKRKRTSKFSGLAADFGL